eukprot:TRINITY_DN41305_c0_g1_i1.p1 TRINITY_DN41305_c0_g1~~TRINITY_DN41305_c0_g1_i1.p1  ORF type:complete len:207 (-),score=49.53 TRINITY_DN41305_c0_g1_i1:14-634(-)
MPRKPSKEVPAELRERRKARAKKDTQEENDTEPEEKEVKQEEEEEKEEKLTTTVVIVNSIIAIIFASLPHSEGDYKGALLILAFNVLWTLAFHHTSFMDYTVLVLSNAMLGVYANKIVTEYHVVPGLLPPTHWALLLGSNGTIGFAYWWKYIRGIPRREKETQWNILVLVLFFLDCLLGLATGVFTLRHLMLVFGRMKNFALTGGL